MVGQGEGHLLVTSLARFLIRIELDALSRDAKRFLARKTAQVPRPLLHSCNRNHSCIMDMHGTSEPG